jgi:hypothetical protein
LLVFRVLVIARETEPIKFLVLAALGLNPGLAATFRKQAFSPRKLKSSACVPSNYITQNMPTHLLVHGDKERYVSFEQSVIMVKTMKNAGGQCKIHTVKK